jgi:hypothetical protein
VQVGFLAGLQQSHCNLIPVGTLCHQPLGSRNKGSACRKHTRTDVGYQVLKRDLGEKLGKEARPVRLHLHSRRLHNCRDVVSLQASISFIKIASNTALSYTVSTVQQEEFSNRSRTVISTPSSYKIREAYTHASSLFAILKEIKLHGSTNRW